MYIYVYVYVYIYIYIYTIIYIYTHPQHGGFAVGKQWGAVGWGGEG